MTDFLCSAPTLRVDVPVDGTDDARSSGTLAELRTLARSAPDAVAGFALVGELCAHSTQVLAPALAELADASNDVVLDLSGVTFADAAALTMLLDLGSTLADRGATLVIDPVSSCVERVVALTGIELDPPRHPAGALDDPATSSQEGAR